jgi:hypothetical protein
MGNVKDIFIKYDWPAALSAALICLVLAYPLFGVYLFSPNTHMYAFGGDAFAIYYDIVWQVCHGNGNMLSAMNYPHGELIFLTDAQGALSMLLSWIHRHVFAICDYTIGIVHALNAWSFIVCAFIMYYLLRAVGADRLTACAFSPFISILAPHILRIGGHFGLAYPFILPISMLWFLRKYHHPKAEWRDLAFICIMLFFTFNNPYVGIGAAGLLILASIFRILKDKNFKPGIFAAISGLLIIAVPYLYLKINDPVQDRIKLQWGFFNYYAKAEGFFFAPGSLMDRLAQSVYGSGFNVDFESKINVGLPVTLILSAYILLKIFRSDTVNNIRMNMAFKALTFGSMVMFIYASAFIFMAFDRAFTEEKLGALLMFKAVARLAWPIYFILTAAAISILSQYLNQKKASVKFIVLFLFMSLWFWEIQVYVKPHFENIKHDNYFNVRKRDDIQRLLAYSPKKPDDFQAILAIPKMMMWNDNFISDLHFNTQFYSMRISQATGVPLISSMLSRMSVSHMAESLEFHADPLIEKSLPSKFPNNKNILVVLGKDHPPLNGGEKWIVSVSDTLLDADGFILLDLPLERINNNDQVRLVRQLAAENPDGGASDVRHVHYNDQQSQYSYYGKGAGYFEKGTHLVMEEVIESPLSNHYMFSAWTRFDHLRYGIGKFRFIIQNSNGEIIFDESPDTRRSEDVHDEWIRTGMWLPVQPGCKVQVFFVANRPLFIDELILRPDNQNYWVTNDDHILFNGFRVLK